MLKRFINKETISYLVFGLLSTVVNFVAFSLCELVHIPYIYGTMIAWACAVVFAYVTQKMFVFQNKDWRKQTVIKELSGFLACRIASGVFDVLFMGLAVGILLMNPFVAKLLSNVFVAIFNYIFGKWFIFKKSAHI